MIRILFLLQKIFIRNILKKCIAQIDEICNKDDLFCIFDIKGDYIYLLIIFEKDGYCEDKSNELFCKIICNILKNCNIKAKIGIGNKVENLTKVSQSFCEAKIVCNVSKEGIGYFNNINYTYHQENRLFRKEIELCDVLIQKNRELTIELIEELFSDLFLSKLSEYDIFKRIYEIIIILNSNFYNKYNIELHCVHEILDNMYEYENISNLKKDIIKMINETLVIVENINNDSYKKAIDKVCDYLNENYMNDINLEDISQQAGFSKYYFSKIFKKYKNRNFIDYLIQLRIKKVKELLESTNLCIKEISEKVGYCDANYFTNLFKKVTGQTPTAYRKK
jgi:two-component system response regulator YesN